MPFIFYEGHMFKIAIAADHAGFELKGQIASHLKKLGHDVSDLGCHSSDSVDYPDYAVLVAKNVGAKQVDRGILICGTGVGMAITANKTRGVRAASLADVFSAKMARSHNDLNVLCLGARVVGTGLAQMIVETFINTAFEGGRHQKRIEKME